MITNGQLTALDSLLTRLQSDVNKLKSDVKDVKDRASATINKPACVGCSAALSPVLDKLDLDSLSISVSTDWTWAQQTREAETLVGSDHLGLA